LGDIMGTEDEPDVMSFEGFSVDSSETIPIAHAIGGFLGNCSAMEHLADAWLDAMSRDEVLAATLKQQRLASH
jgi:hypothetical protein